MVKVYSRALDTSNEVERIIGQIKGESSGATVIFMAGIHGNEPSGVFALKRVMEGIISEKIPLKGNCYAIAGNLKALEAGIRYQKEDLNRIWNPERIKKLKLKTSRDQDGEEVEQSEILKTLSGILERENGPFYFIDLHTTSSKTSPFLTVNDTILNRKFTQQYPVPLLLGIEEYLDGTFLNFINQLGYVAFGFESGQHDEVSSIDNHASFVYQTLVFSGIIEKTDVEYEVHHNILASATKNLARFYEIVYHYKIGQREDYHSQAGLTNFEPVQKGQKVGYSNNVPVFSPVGGSIFMPLYQRQGDDGFFVIKPIPSLFLSLSIVLRKVRVDHIMTLLPGVSWGSKRKDTLKVNLKVARFFAKNIFHLMGYRSRTIEKNHIIARNRDAVSKWNHYANEKWNQKRFG